MVANAPELTVLRDTDGDDVADEYQIIYTGLNNLRHSVHGLNWGPDGWLYFTMGNTWVKPNAPKPIRDLQGIKSDDKTQYQIDQSLYERDLPKSFHPLNKQEMEGGFLDVNLEGMISNFSHAACETPGICAWTVASIGLQPTMTQVGLEREFSCLSDTAIIQ